jgi:prepilin-type N-terminal cleavage/methylation domain-containing protein
LLKRAFTLIELLVVIAIIAILAAILFPVFAQAKEQAKKTVAISNMKQAGLASAMYSNDVDDSYVMSDTFTDMGSFYGWGYGPPDADPFEEMFPYTKNFDITIDPMSDLQGVAAREQAEFTYIGAPFYPPLISQGTPAQLEYAAGIRSNIGYNFAFFSPWIYDPAINYGGSLSTNGSSVTNPAHTLMWGDASIWNRVNGAPTGGGNWVIQTPCWQSANGAYLQPIAALVANGTIFSYGSGWDPNPLSWIVYGGLWPYYEQTSSTAATASQNGHVVIGFADSHCKTMAISQVAAGCSAYGTGAQQGRVTNPSLFIWATNQ